MNKEDLQSLKALIGDEKDWVAILAYASAFIYDCLDNVNWVGFYRLKQDELLLGPFIGHPSCIHLPLSQGVCAYAVEKKDLVNVPDVHKFSSHIACDSQTNSECVIPLKVDDTIIGVLDIDSYLINRFSKEDEIILKKLLQLFLSSFFLIFIE
jgi:GAF domain-containing protein